MELITLMKDNHLKILEVSLNNETYKLEVFEDIKNECNKIIQDIKLFEDILIKSPIVGTAYLKKQLKSVQEEASYGGSSSVSKGDILCTIESMKLYHEIIAEENYDIIEICFEDGQLVEFGQTLFKVRKKG